MIEARTVVNDGYHRLLMLLAPRRSSTTAELLRLVAVWLVAVLLFEGFAVTQSRAAGPLHHHRQQSAPRLFTHAAQAHVHDGTERHHHDLGDASVVLEHDAAATDEALDAATSALSVAFALLALGAALLLFGKSGRVWRSADAWPWLTRIPPLTLKPPRRA